MPWLTRHLGVGLALEFKFGANELRPQAVVYIAAARRASNPQILIGTRNYQKLP